MGDLNLEKLKELGEMVARSFGIDADRFVENFQEEMRLEKEREKRHEQTVREFNRQQASLFNRYGDKRLEVSANFFDVAMKELRNSFILGEEGGMLAFFRSLDSILYCNEFYGTDWIQRNEYGHGGSMNIWLREKDSSDEDYSVSQHSFGFRIERLARLVRRRNKDELLVICHTHPGVAYPSENDSQPYSLNMIIGFDQVSEELRQVIHKSFGHPPRSETQTKRPIYHGQVPAREWKRYIEAFEHGNLMRMVPNDISPEAYDEIVAKCGPTIRFFHTDEKGNPNRIPLYVNGHELL